MGTRAGGIGPGSASRQGRMLTILSLKGLGPGPELWRLVERYEDGLRGRSADFERSWKLTSIAALTAPLAAGWRSAFCACSFWPKPSCRRCAMSEPCTVSDSSGGELGQCPSKIDRFLDSYAECAGTGASAPPGGRLAVTAGGGAAHAVREGSSTSRRVE